MSGVRSFGNCVSKFFPIAQMIPCAVRRKSARTKTDFFSTQDRIVRVSVGQFKFRGALRTGNRGAGHRSPHRRMTKMESAAAPRPSHGQPIWAKTTTTARTPEKSDDRPDLVQFPSPIWYQIDARPPAGISPRSLPDSDEAVKGVLPVLLRVSKSTLSGNHVVKMLSPVHGSRCLSMALNGSCCQFNIRRVKELRG